MTISRFRFLSRFVCTLIVVGASAAACSVEAHASPPGLQAQPGCGQDQGSSPRCTAQQLRVLNTRMHALYRAELARTQGSIAERRLIHAQNQWRHYANADCMFANGPRREGGQAWAQHEDACLASHVRQRIARLQSEVDCRPGRCPPPR